MKKFYTLSTLVVGLLVIDAISGCSKTASTPKPTPPNFDVNLLLGAQWTTTGAVITKTDGSTLTLKSTDPLIGSLYLSDVTFLTLPTASASGTANESDYGALTWTYTDATSNLVVVFSPVDGSVNATITKLDTHTLVLHRTNNPDDGGDYKIIDQTLTR